MINQETQDNKYQPEVFDKNSLMSKQQNFKEPTRRISPQNAIKINSEADQLTSHDKNIELQRKDKMGKNKIIKMENQDLNNSKREAPKFLQSTNKSKQSRKSNEIDQKLKQNMPDESLMNKQSPSELIVQVDDSNLYDTIAQETFIDNEPIHQEQVINNKQSAPFDQMQQQNTKKERKDREKKKFINNLDEFIHTFKKLDIKDEQQITNQAQENQQKKLPSISKVKEEKKKQSDDFNFDILVKRLEMKDKGIDPYVFFNQRLPNFKRKHSDEDLKNQSSESDQDSETEQVTENSVISNMFRQTNKFMNSWIDEELQKLLDVKKNPVQQIADQSQLNISLSDDDKNVKKPTRYQRIIPFPNVKETKERKPRGTGLKNVSQPLTGSQQEQLNLMEKENQDISNIAIQLNPLNILKPKEEQKVQNLKEKDELDLIDDEIDKMLTNQKNQEVNLKQQQTFEIGVNLRYRPGIEPQKIHTFTFHRNLDGLFQLHFGELILHKFDYRRYQFILKSHGPKFTKEVMENFDSNNQIQKSSKQNSQDQKQEEQKSNNKEEQIIPGPIDDDKQELALLVSLLSVEEEQKSIILEQQPNKNFQNNFMNYYRAKQYMSFEDFKSKPKLAEIFNLNSQRDIDYIEKRLLIHKPRPNDKPGYVYVYYREIDEIKFKEGKLSHLILYKVGKTINLPSKRVGMQQSKNGEAYKIRETFSSKFNSYLEFMTHLYFDQCRVVRPDLKDGKTEWFMATYSELRDVISKIKLFMIRHFGDIGSDQIIEQKPSTYNKNSKVKSKNIVADQEEYVGVRTRGQKLLLNEAII
eukprot:403351210